MSRRPQIQSGWCQTSNHIRCSHLLQEKTDQKREVRCSCPCHR